MGERLGFHNTLAGQPERSGIRGTLARQKASTR